MANVWRNPIFDRTLDDVTFAIQKIQAWKRSHTHSGEVRVENGTLVLQDTGTVYTDEDAIILLNEGAVYVEDGVLMLDVGNVYGLKGCLNLLDLNRIEENIAYLADKMESYSYSPNIHEKRWKDADLPNQNDMSRIIDNIRALTDAFYSPDNPPSLPTTMLSYHDVNAIEENLYLIKQLLDCMESSFKQVGTIKSGATTFLPLRR